MMHYCNYFTRSSCIHCNTACSLIIYPHCNRGNSWKELVRKWQSKRITDAGIPSRMKMNMILLLLYVYLTCCSCHGGGSFGLSSEEHHNHHEHNGDYDKKMFLGGEEEAEDFSDLSPEEQLKRLRSIIRKIDQNADGYLTEEELSTWIQKSFRHYILEDTKEQFAEFDKDRNGIVSWDEYNIQMYDRIIDYDENMVLQDDEEESFRLIHLKDKKRFDHADRDGSPGLNLMEFTDFEHPEETDHMQEFVIDGALEEHDKDGDGFVSLAEYLGEYTDDEESVEYPQWIIVEKDRFVNDYDKDGDGKLNPTELLSWIVPNNKGISQEEANHLIEEIDDDDDRRLSEAEILLHRELFLTSEATDYGRQLQDAHFYHDEL